MPDRRLRTCLIGLGRQTIENHLPAVLEARNVSLDSVCDQNSKLANEVGAQYGVPAFAKIEDLLSERDPELAILCVPHSMYLPMIQILAEKGVHILKEKPFAMSMEEACAIHSIVEEHGILLKVTLVRRYHPIFSSFEQLSRRIGRIHTIEGRYTLNITRLDEGWRSKRASSGGGAVLDMGYHTIDLLVWYFGLPDRVFAHMGAYARENQDYDVEDTAMVLFVYDATASKIPVMGQMVLSRAFPTKDERLLIVGSRGAIEIKRGEIVRLGPDYAEIEALNRKGSWLSASIDQIEDFAKAISNKRKIGRPPYFDHFAHMAFIDAIYASHSSKSPVSPSDLLPDFVRNS